MRMLAGATAIALFAVGTARAEAPRVVVDIAPIHSLASQVMEGIGEPALLLPANASPHHYALKPSQARLLSNAELVIWVGDGLAPWLASSLGALADDALIVELLDEETLVRLPARIRAKKTSTGKDHESGYKQFSRARGTLDPHLWLDPENARILVGILAEALAKLDPENAPQYRENAARAAAAIDTLIAETELALAPVKDASFITFHDAYQYFEARFELTSAGSVTLTDAAAPGARRISNVRATLREREAKCLFAEPQFPERTVTMIVRGTDARTGTLDPMGIDLEPGSAHYAALIRALTKNLRDCLK